MKKRLWLFTAVITIVSLLAFVISCDEGDNGDKPISFEITSPYADINWETFGQFKSANHVHTTNSDGSGSMEQVLKLHYDLNYDIVTITDHVWRSEPNDSSNQTHRAYLDLVSNSVTQETWTTSSGTGNHAGPDKTWPLTFITQARLTEFETGAAIVGTIAGQDTRPAGKPMLMMSGTAEFAPGGGATPDELAVFFFPETAKAPNAWSVDIKAGIQRVHDAGAICFINHPGRSTQAMGFTGSASAPGNPSNQRNWVLRYVDLFMEFPVTSLAGFEIFNRKDQDSRHDRVLWDNVLTVTIPEGRFVWGYGNDDLHSFAINPTGTGAHINYNMFLMTENSPENFRNAMEKGHSYIVTVEAKNEGVVVRSDTPESERPSIKSVTVDEEAQTITIVAENANKIVWITEGRTIMTTTGATSTIELTNKDLVKEIGVYVRANIIGDGGMAVIQPIGTKKK